MKIIYSAPAKIIISGEYAAVFGKPALACAINKRIKVTIREGVFKGKDIYKMLDIATRVKSWLKKNKIEFENKKFDYKIESQVPFGQGFGSSAALSSAASAGLLEYFTGKEFSKEQINEVAYECEKIFHGSPSGIDNSVSTFGGLVYFRKEFEFLKNLSKLDFKIPIEIQDRMFIISSGERKESTADLVSMVKESTEENSAKNKKIMLDIEKVTHKITIGIKENEPGLIESMIGRNQNLLTKLGVVSEKAKNLKKDLEDLAIIKITGAGGVKDGSGFMLAFAKEKKAERLVNFLEKKNIEFYNFEGDFEGVKKELI